MTEVSAAVKRLSIIDESLISTPPENCILFLQLTDDHLSFSLLDRIRNKFIALCEYRLPENSDAGEISALLQQDELLGNRFYKTVIAVSTDVASLVPAAIFKKEDAAKLLALTCAVPDDLTLLADHLKFTDTVHIYALSSDIATLLSSSFPSATIVHTGSVLIESELLRNKNNMDHCLAVNVQHGSFEIVATRAGKLIYYNTFNYQSSEDFIYYILFVMEQLRLNPEKTQLLFTGDIEKQAASYIITSRYVRNISFGRRPEAFEFSYGFASLSPQAQYILLNQHLCVS